MSVTHRGPATAPRPSGEGLAARLLAGALALAYLLALAVLPAPRALRERLGPAGRARLAAGAREAPAAPGGLGPRQAHAFRLAWADARPCRGAPEMIPVLEHTGGAPAGWDPGRGSPPTRAWRPPARDPAELLGHLEVASSGPAPRPGRDPGVRPVRRGDPPEGVPAPGARLTSFPHP